MQCFDHFVLINANHSCAWSTTRKLKIILRDGKMVGTQTSFLIKINFKEASHQ